MKLITSKDYLKDIVILERNVDMLFGGINPNQIAPKHFRDEI